MAHVAAAIAAAGTTAMSEQSNAQGLADGNDATARAASARDRHLKAENDALARKLVANQTLVNAIAAVIGWGVEIKYALATFF